MKENSRLLLEKAQRAIQAAQTLQAAGNLPDFATGYRPYPQLIIQECSFGAQKGDEWSA